MSRRLSLLLFAALAMVLAVAMAGARLDGRSGMTAQHTLGQGSVVVLVHGLGSNVDHWLPTARLLARSHRVVLVELPGHGEAAMPSPFTLERASESLADAIAQASRDPVVLIGHSVGGLVAAEVARLDPARVSALVLVETALKPQFTVPERAALRSALDRDYPHVVRDVYSSFGRDSAQGAQLAEDAAALDRRMMRSWIDLALDADLSRVAGEIQAPALAVVSDRTWPRDESWSSTARALGYQRLLGLQVARLDSCGHFVMLDRPADLALAIERFLATPQLQPVALN